MLRFNTALGYLTSLITTLVVVTSSLPQPPFGPGKDIFSKGNVLPPGGEPPPNCPRSDVHLTTLRNSDAVAQALKSPKNHSKALEPRQNPLPCGITLAGYESERFIFPASSVVELHWHILGNPPLTWEVILLKRVNQNPNGADIDIGWGTLRHYQHIPFVPIANRSYYVLPLGNNNEVAWWFEPV